MSKFYFANDSGNVSEADDEDNLPYPQALPRSDFLAPDFDATSYLSTLSNRHQTLEDLRSDLRERSQLLSKELLDLVNTNYEQFLSLGSDLRGGEEKIEDVRVGLLAFKRGAEDVRSKVRERRLEVGALIEQKKTVGREIVLARKLLELDSRLEELEGRLMVSSLGRSANGNDDAPWSESDDDGEEDDYALEGVTGARKLQRLAREYQHICHLMASIGMHHPFVQGQESRVMRLRNTLLLDLSTSLKQAKSDTRPDSTRLVKVLEVYREMNESAEAVKALRGLKS